LSEQEDPEELEEVEQDLLEVQILLQVRQTLVGEVVAVPHITYLVHIK
jgi:hypothetical protein